MAINGNWFTKIISVSGHHLIYCQTVIQENKKPEGEELTCRACANIPNRNSVPGCLSPSLFPSFSASQTFLSLIPRTGQEIRERKGGQGNSVRIGGGAIKSNAYFKKIRQPNADCSQTERCGHRSDRNTLTYRIHTTYMKNGILDLKGKFSCFTDLSEPDNRSFILAIPWRVGTTAEGFSKYFCFSVSYSLQYSI